MGGILVEISADRVEGNVDTAAGRKTPGGRLSTESFLLVVVVPASS